MLPGYKITELGSTASKLCRQLINATTATLKLGELAQSLIKKTERFINNSSLPSYKMKGKKAGTGKIIVSGTIVANLIFGGVAKAEDPNSGYMIITNYVEGANIGNTLDIGHLSPGVTDGYDVGWDSAFLVPMPGESAIYSDISDIEEPPYDRLDWDYRLTSSKKDFLIQLVYNGTLASDANNYLNFRFSPDLPGWKFGNKPMIFDSNLVPYGPVVDIRRAMEHQSDPNKLDLYLVKLRAGNHTTTPYESATLSIGTRLLADLDDNGIVDFIDLAIFANDWKNHLKETPQTKCIGNISGPNGIPDGYNGKAVVDEIDLIEFAEQWLVDPNTIAKAIQTLPKEYLAKLNETAQKLLDYKGQTDQNIVCKFYQSPLEQGLSEDGIRGLARNPEKPPLKQMLALSNNNHEPLSRNHKTLNRKLHTNTHIAFTALQSGFDLVRPPPPANRPVAAA